MHLRSTNTENIMQIYVYEKATSLLAAVVAGVKKHEIEDVVAEIFGVDVVVGQHESLACTYWPNGVVSEESLDSNDVSFYDVEEFKCFN